MGTLSAALGTAGNALTVLEQAMGVVQNNVANASTPGYVTQTPILTAGAFDPTRGVWGGVQDSGTQSARNAYAEEAVWSANEQVGAATQQASSLQNLQSIFNISGTSGIPAALSSLSSAFSAWSTTSDATAQQQVINAAQGVAQAFNEAASNAGQIQSQTDQQLQSTINQINQLSTSIAKLNGQIRNGAQQDAGLNAQLYSDLEQLSNLVSINVETQSDGTVTVLMGGQVPLVIGSSQEAISVQSGGGTVPDATILTSDGQDVTRLASNQGQLGGLLQFRNAVLPTVVGDGAQPGGLNQLAQGVADTVNGLLTSAQVSAGGTGIDLFVYDPGSPTAVAGSLAVNASFTTAQLVASNGTAANGTANQLAQMGDTSIAALGGLNPTNFYSRIASDIGTQASSASTAKQTETDVLTQAQNLRAQLSGVSLNDQATNLLQFQQAYQAAAQAIATIRSTMQYFFTSMQQVG
ncbi:MAG: flagellar hook-associated protein FlgK [Acidobacteriaceae bacterium]|nr:flagellar hook-associated protein FlgK [Acidobacteriaceae bacterium]